MYLYYRRLFDLIITPRNCTCIVDVLFLGTKRARHWWSRSAYRISYFVDRLAAGRYRVEVCHPSRLSWNMEMFPDRKLRPLTTYGDSSQPCRKFEATSSSCSKWMCTSCLKSFGERRRSYSWTSSQDLYIKRSCGLSGQQDTLNVDV